jgi:hypothetical protein
MRFFPNYSYGRRVPVRAQQRVGTGGYTEYKGSSSDGGGGVQIGVIDNPNDSYNAYGYISFDTGHSSQVYKGFLAGTTDEVTSPSNLGQYGQVMMGTPIFYNDGIRAFTWGREYENSQSHGGRSFWASAVLSNTTNGREVGTYWSRYADGTTYINSYADTGHTWYDAPATGSYTTLMSLNSSGNLAVTGSLSKGSGSFDIPHPVTEGKRLRHSFIEGPYADLIYRGTVTLGAEPVTICMDEQYGMAEGTWKALNTNPWSIVSASGKLVEWSLDECKLTITGDEGTVCQWMVIGERKDQHMIDTDSTDNDGRLVLEYTPTAEPEDIHEQPPTSGN